MPEMLAPVETEQEQKKLLVDKDVYEEIEQLHQKIEDAMIAYEKKLDALANKRNQLEMILDSLEAKS